jgi:hypothetical protein
VKNGELKMKKWNALHPFLSGEAGCKFFSKVRLVLIISQCAFGGGIRKPATQKRQPRTK